MSQAIGRLQLEQGVPEKREISRQRLRRACQEFEGIFMSAMLRAMRNTLPSGGILPASISRRVWESQFDAILGEVLGKTGSLGLAQMLYEDVVGNNERQTRTDDSRQRQAEVGDSLNP